MLLPRNSEADVVWVPRRQMSVLMSKCSEGCFTMLKSCTSARRHKDTVAGIPQRDIQDVFNPQTAYLEIFETTSTYIGNYTVVAEYIDGGNLRNKPSANRFQLTDKVVCEQVINRSIAVVIYAPSLNRETQSEYLSRVSSTAYAVGFYSIPTIGVMVREAEFSKKKIYPTFVRPTPSYADESFVFLNLLRRLDYRQVVVVNVKGDRNGEQFVELFEKKRKKYKIHVQSYIELEINGFLNSSLAASFEEFTSNIVALYAT
ncbi:hypothetical protein RB195_018942 [Necator americanus]|uniref:Receptor ligand binding region domain-containing protein n=1 Tax=Necator americanus TaxID=51031 RepID=A0ABR1CEL0_NECAM